MTLLLLDTRFLIDAERSDAQLDQAIDDADDVAIAAITVAELHVGVRLATGRRRQQRRPAVSDNGLPRVNVIGPVP
jgi:tRNA(fMet)-specific endonuclease VapC